MSWVVEYNERTKGGFMNSYEVINDPSSFFKIMNKETEHEYCFNDCIEVLGGRNNDLPSQTSTQMIKKFKIINNNNEYELTISNYEPFHFSNSSLFYDNTHNTLAITHLISESGKKRPYLHGFIFYDLKL